MFNTLKDAKIMEEVGFTKEQAETTIRVLAEIMEDTLASKEDVKELRLEMDHRFTQLESNLQHAISQVDSKLALVESKLTIRMGTMLAASIAILTAIQKLV